MGAEIPQSELRIDAHCNLRLFTADVKCTQKYTYNNIWFKELDDAYLHKNKEISNKNCFLHGKTHDLQKT